ncbi:MAG TPA: serine protease [Reyranellaceae bacterium]|nr:serine protease [Reyranellaceae bacterium]
MNDTVKRLLVWAVIIGVLYGASAIFDSAEFAQPRRPLPPDEGGGAWLRRTPAAAPQGRTPTDPLFDTIVEELGPVKEDVIGTAFVVAPNLWVTAAHVLEPCTTSYVRIQGRWRRVTEAKAHPAADVAILRTEATERPPTVGMTDRLPVLDQEGFHVGYPQGVPSTVYTRMIGLTRIRAGKPGTPIEQGWVWAELERVPATTGTLGGLSGGPQVDRTGAVQGVTILHSERTARVTTTPMRRIREVVPAEVPPVVAGGSNIGRLDFAQHGEQARQSGAVSLVFCSASGRTRPRS